MPKLVDLSKWKTSLMKLFKGDKKVTFIVIAGALGILLIFISGIGSKKEAPADIVKKQTSAEFAQAMESRLSEIIGSISGVGNCKIMITLENGVEYVYAKDSKTTDDQLQDGSGEDQRIQDKLSSENKLIIIDSNDGGKEGLLLKEIEPTIRGVVIVCEGGNDTLVQSHVISAVSTALGISSARIFVTKLN